LFCQYVNDRFSLIANVNSIAIKLIESFLISLKKDKIREPD
jgi:hypothetical protein